MDRTWAGALAYAVGGGVSTPASATLGDPAAVLAAVDLELGVGG